MNFLYTYDLFLCSNHRVTGSPHSHITPMCRDYLPALVTGERVYGQGASGGFPRAQESSIPLGSPAPSVHHPWLSWGSRREVQELRGEPSMQLKFSCPPCAQNRGASQVLLGNPPYFSPALATLSLQPASPSGALAAGGAAGILSCHGVAWH